MTRVMFPCPRELVLSLSLQGIPFVLCNEKGISSLVNSFTTAKARSLSFDAERTLTVVQFLARVLNLAALLQLITFGVRGTTFLVWV